MVNPQITFCWWEHPEQDYVKLSTDGSARDSDSGIGGLIRDSEGNVIAAFTGTGAAKDILSLESQDFQKGLELCMELGFRKIEAAVDNKQVAYLIRHIWQIPWRQARVLNEITKWSNYRVSL